MLVTKLNALKYDYSTVRTVTAKLYVLFWENILTQLFDFEHTCTNVTKTMSLRTLLKRLKWYKSGTAEVII